MPGENVGKSISNLIDGLTNYTNTHTLSSSLSLQVHTNKRSGFRTVPFLYLDIFFIRLQMWGEESWKRKAAKVCWREVELENDALRISASANRAYTYIPLPTVAPVAKQISKIHLTLVRRWPSSLRTRPMYRVCSPCIVLPVLHSPHFVSLQLSPPTGQKCAIVQLNKSWILVGSRFICCAVNRRQEGW